MKRSRLLRALKWGCTLSFVLLTALHATSHGWTLHYWQDANIPVSGIDLESGALTLSWQINSNPTAPAPGSVQILAVKGASAKPIAHSNPSFPGVCGYSVSQSLLNQGVTLTIASVQQVRIPMLVMTIPLAVAAIVLWRRDRVIPIGHCTKCRYNLTGNTSGVCPECGLKTGVFSRRVTSA